MKYCPNCGAKVTAKDKFCPNCGQVLPQPVQQSAVTKLTKHRRLRSICLTIAAVVLVIAAIGTVCFTIASQNNNSPLSFSHPAVKHQRRTTPKHQDSAADTDKQDNRRNADNDEKDSLSWSATKESQLADFMKTFGKKMKQKYDEYDGQHSLKTLAGQDYPEIFEQTDFKLYSDHSSKTERIDIGWDPLLKKDYDYHVVSIFNCNVGNPETHITYLFCIHDQQPLVLVDQTTNGEDVMVKETANHEVRDAFNEIATGNNDN